MTPIKCFVYGTLKRGFGNHRLLTTSTFLGEDTLEATMFSLGGYPAIHLGGSTVKGEVYEVTDNDVLKALDRLEGVSTGFYQRVETKTDNGVDVNVYVMDKEYLDSTHKQVEDGYWAPDQWNREDAY